MQRMQTYLPVGLAAIVVLCQCVAADEQLPPRARAIAGLRRAAEFFHSEVATHGGYVWRCSGDLSVREGEAETGPDTIWVQPPGTPSVGMAFLDAYRATADPYYLHAAYDAAYALLGGQLRSGGWWYAIRFDDEGRQQRAYRWESPGRTWPPPEAPAVTGEHTGGWHIWRRRENEGNITILDDDTTQAAIRFLARIDKALGFKDQRLHEAVQYALESVLRAQYPNGAWSHNYDRFPTGTPDPRKYPVIEASYPDSWSRTWPKAFAGCYMLNDDIVQDMIRTLLAARDVYGQQRLLDAAQKGGDFLLLAQMPPPQPAWAQQYDTEMHPVWDRKFEPPAITGLESQSVLEALVLLYRHTGEGKYLEPIPQALAYLKSSLLPDGRLARFYELRTNRPLYFTRDYELTYSKDDAPSHYSFTVPSRLDQIEHEYRRLADASQPALAPQATADRHESRQLQQQVERVLDDLDERGAWVERGTLDAHDVEPASGIISSRTFVENVRILCRFITSGGGPAP